MFWGNNATLLFFQGNAISSRMEEVAESDCSRANWIKLNVWEKQLEILWNRDYMDWMKMCIHNWSTKLLNSKILHYLHQYNTDNNSQTACHFFFRWLHSCSLFFISCAVIMWWYSSRHSNPVCLAYQVLVRSRVHPLYLEGNSMLCPIFRAA